MRKTHARNRQIPFGFWVWMPHNEQVHQQFRASSPHPPAAQGLYDPRHEHDACGVGFIAHIKGQKSHAIVSQALQLLINLLHRGACGCEVNTGDGAGILMQMPDRFFRKEAARLGIALPEERGYGAGLVFLPQDQAARDRVETLFEEIVIDEGQLVLGWRDVPTDISGVGPSAQAVAPVFRQLFIGRGPALPAAGRSLEGDAQFERKLYVIRKRIEHAIDASDLPPDEKKFFYVVSLSSNTLIYKGMLTADQMGPMFPDLLDPAMESALALVHQRFSTNTFPSWPLAHPYRYVAHNGEINTLRGNINWMKAREALLRSDVLGHDLKKILPIIREGGSDTAIFDNVLELLVMAGRSLPHAVLMMIPEPWQNHEGMSPARRAFYEYHSSLMEPWDGPASIAFTDGTVIGAVLDRNGLRPSRYYVTKDDFVIMASEVGVLDVPPEDIVLKERLHPGRVLLVDTAQGRIISDEEIKEQLARERPYAEWLERHLIAIEDVPDAPFLPPPDHPTVLRRQQAFGYTQEDVTLLLAQMARAGEEALGSMGTDTPLAALSERPRLLYDYFKQLFAQVTNPPLDAIREELVTSMESTIGPERNLLAPEPESCRQINVRYPIIDNDQLAKLRHINSTPLQGFRSVTLPMIYDPRDGGAALERAMDRLKAQAFAAVESGHTILILSDRGVTAKCAPIPEPARDRGRPPSPRARGRADALRAHRRIGRRARSAPRGAPHRLRRRRRQPVPRLRDARRHDRAARHRRRDAREGDGELHQGAQQGHPQGDVQDGHLHAPELLRRPDLRGDRPRAGVRRQVLHVDGVADRRRRHRRHRAGGPVSGTPTRFRRARRRRPSSIRAASTSGGATASCTCSTRKRCRCCSTRRAPGSTRSTASGPAS